MLGSLSPEGNGYSIVRRCSLHYCQRRVLDTIFPEYFGRWCQSVPVTLLPEGIGDNIARYVGYNVAGRYWIQSFQSIPETKLPEEIGYTVVRDYWIQDTVWPE